MKKVTIIGMGVMGNAIASVLKDAYEITGIDQEDNLNRTVGADVVILAVKPQSFKDLSHDLRMYIVDQTILSIMAGISLADIVKSLGTERVVRSMPNLAVGKARSVTGAYSYDRNRPHLLQELLRLWGEVIWLEEESEFDIFTALAGSGPAYFFEVARCLQAAAVKHGFGDEQAQHIVNATLGSAAALLDRQSPAAMIARVASKGGTTEAALSVLAKHELSAVIEEAVEAAAARSKELS
jgi:pyrroline-5-carboxylate reductase